MSKEALEVSLSALDLRLGLRVQVLDDEGYECVGTVHGVDQKLKILRLKECRNVTTGLVAAGIQTFNEDSLKSLAIMKEDCKPPPTELPSPSLESLSSRESSSSLETASSSQAIATPSSERAGSSTLLPTVVTAGETGRRNGIQPIYRDHRSNHHLGYLHQLDMKSILSQDISTSQPEAAISQEPRSLGAPIPIPKPSQVVQHQDGDAFKHRINVEFEAARSIIWKKVEAGEGFQPIYPDLRCCPSEYFFIDRIQSPQFSQAVRFLRGCSLLGVSLEGQVLGRCGKLSLLLFSTKKSVFIFDVFAMGRDCFQNGLGDILEARDIMKVFHDVRLASDMLFHNCGVNLTNVYDTLAAHCVFVTWKVYAGYLPQNATAVSNLARCYLGIATEDLFYPHYRLQHLKDDMSVWMNRPLQSHLLWGAIRNVMYLLDLQWTTRECMMSPFFTATNVLLESVKKCDDFYEAKQKMLELEKLPDDFIRCLPNLKPDEKRKVRGVVDNPRRRVHNAVGQSDPNVIFSRDCLHQTNPRKN